MSLYLPLLNGRLIDIITAGVDRMALRNMVIIISIVSISNLVMGYFLSIIFRYITTNIMQLINDQVMNHIRALSLKFSHNINTGYLTQRIVTDSNVVANFTLTSVRDFPLSIFAIVFNIVILIRINMMMGLVLFILIPIYIGLFVAFRKKMYQSNLSYKESESHYFEEMNSQIENIKFVKVNALKTMFNESLRTSFSTFFGKLMTYTKFSTLFSNLGSFITVCANIIILILGVNEIFDGNLTIGEFTIITTYFNMVIGNIDYFLNFFKNYQTTSVSYHRLNDVFEQEKEEIGKCELEDVKKIEFKGVHFSHGLDPLITDFSFTFEKGKIYRICGQNGKGKSTLMDLILGLHEEYEGEITINDTNIKEVNLYQMRRDLVAVVEQNLTIINGSVIRNIQLDTEINHDRLSYLNEKLNLNQFFEKNNFDIRLSRKSNGLSGGEKQKLNIVRNFLKESQLLMLDEANSALDVKSSLALKELINEEKENRITILIAHNEMFDDIVDDEINL
ncbi:MAG: ABC transporter ATP-binding protein/permease [Defluviitaleaceae bacterium]|nr:ABC transporter ATP-binding protein/permease [Defluviitaleaceae bacterium]